MAALRSALATLSRGSSGSSAAAYMGGRGLQINEVLRHAPRPLHPADIRNVEGCRRFSTGVKEPVDKPESVPRMCWLWAKYRIKNADMEERSRALFVYMVFVLGTPTVYMVKVTKEILSSDI